MSAVLQLGEVPRDELPGPQTRSWRLRGVREFDLPLLLEHRKKDSTRRWLESQEPVSPVQQLAWFHSGQAELVRVIECDGVAVGIGRIRPSSGGEILVGLDIFECFRGQGLGVPAFIAVCAEAERHDGRLALWVFLDNHPAVAIYGKCGFVEDRTSAIRYLMRSAEGGSGATAHAYVKMIRSR